MSKKVTHEVDECVVEEHVEAYAEKPVVVNQVKSSHATNGYLNQAEF